MTSYYRCLIALEHLLNRAGANHWRDCIREDIQLWEDSQDVGHHLSAYGGMGSFNDIVICKENGHSVSEEQEPWVQELFETLKAMAYQLAKAPHWDESSSHLLAPDYRNLVIVEAFKHDPAATGALRAVLSQIDAQKHVLHGWRCLDCGYSETTQIDFERFIARRILEDRLIHAFENTGLKEVVDAAFAVDFPGLDALRENLTQAVVSSGLQIHRTEGWMRPCPNCHSQNTSRYQWEALSSDPPSFRPVTHRKTVRQDA